MKRFRVKYTLLLLLLSHFLLTSTLALLLLLLLQEIYNARVYYLILRIASILAGWSTQVHHHRTLTAISSTIQLWERTTAIIGSHLVLRVSISARAT